MDKKWIDKEITLERATEYHLNPKTMRIYFRDQGTDAIYGYCQYQIDPVDKFKMQIIYFIAPRRGDQALQYVLDTAAKAGIKRILLEVRVDPAEDAKACKARILLYSRNGFTAYTSTYDKSDLTTTLGFQK